MSQLTSLDVLFVCTHNPGRSQMAAGFLTYSAGHHITVRSAGSMPTDQINPAVRQAMAERGLGTVRPGMLSSQQVAKPDVGVAMGCRESCPVFPGKYYRDWVLDDPAGMEVAQVRPFRYQIEQLVRGLLAELAVETTDFPFSARPPMQSSTGLAT